MTEANISTNGNNIELAEIKELDWSVERLVREVNRGWVDFGGAMPRGRTWDSMKNSLLIQSILRGIGIGLFLFNESEGRYECVDGQQRIAAIVSYVNGEYKLHAKTPPLKAKDGRTINISKMNFKQLNSTFQGRIKSYTMKIQYGEDMAIEDKIDLFERINSGKPATGIDRNRVWVLSHNAFFELKQHIVVKNVFSKAVIKKREDENAVQSVWILCYSNTSSLLQADKAKILKQADVTEEQKNEMRMIFDYMHTMFRKALQTKSIYAKMRKTTHFIMLGYMAYLAIKKGIYKEEYADRAIEFFNTDNKTSTTNSAVYDESFRTAGTMTSEQVKIRMLEVEKYLVLPSQEKEL